MEHFQILAKDKKSKARIGKLKTAHGTIETPFFMPVATNAAARYITQEQLQETKTEAIICNGFMLSLKPGLEIIKEFGGIHKFMNWDKIIFTDSGGFQMLSERFLKGTTEHGIHFRSPFDARTHFVTPEKAIQIQNALGADCIMALDFVPEYREDKAYIAKAVKQTHAWAEKCIAAHTNKKQLLFGITQGGIYPDLRKQSAKFINKVDFAGVAIGGLCIGESKEKMFQMVDVSIPLLDEEKPRYLMGVGSPRDLIEAVAHGIDIFDSCFPTRTGRHGNILTTRGNYDITKAKWQYSKLPLDEQCACFVCKKYTRAYIHHLFKVEEATGLMLVSYHNIWLIQDLMQKIRKAIKEGKFEKLRKEFSR
ncbi:tRNA guanosine(34) transglycosylase Tgt [Candidatus Woesearchaeota archaeon]|nr:tRNA guanosine(34) transglycosylase Tgt [Candidatus Woesearchaeota archaeon]